MLVPWGTPVNGAPGQTSRQVSARRRTNPQGAPLNVSANLSSTQASAVRTMTRQRMGAHMVVLLGNSATSSSGGLLKVVPGMGPQPRRLPEEQEVAGGLGSKKPQ